MSIRSVLFDDIKANQEQIEVLMGAKNMPPAAAPKGLAERV